MNHNLKSKLGGILFFEYDDFNCIEFNVVTMGDGTLNLMMDIGYVNTEIEEYPYEYGYTMRTTIFEKDLVDVAKKVSDYLDFGMFEHLVFLNEAYCLNVEGDVEYEFLWDDYFANSSVVLN